MTVLFDFWRLLTICPIYIFNIIMVEYLSHEKAWDEAIAVKAAYEATEYASGLMTPAQDHAGLYTMVRAWELAAYALDDVASLDTLSEAERQEAARSAIDAAFKTGQFDLILELGERDLAYLDQQIEELPAELNDREKMVLKRRFGIGVDAPQTFHKIEPDLGIRRTRISSIQARALNRLRLAALGLPLRGE
jgi:hypothetical protein